MIFINIINKKNYSVKCKTFKVKFKIVILEKKNIFF